MIMKNMIKSLAIVASLIFGMAFCAVSCQEEPVTGPAEFSIVDTNVEVPAEGGEFSATYSLENPVLGEEIVPTCQDSWVSGFHTLKAYEITFTVTENMTGTPREAVVNVEYNGDTYSFTISQGAYATSTEAEGFQTALYYGMVPGSETVANYFIILTSNLDSGTKDVEYYAIDLYGSPWPEDSMDAIGIPTGTYSLDMENSLAAGTFAAENSYYFGYDENGELIDTQYFSSTGTLEVVRDGENYNLKLIVELADGLHCVTYSGPINLDVL